MEPDQAALTEAIPVLLKHLEPAKVARVFSAWNVGGGDYLGIRDQLIKDETVDSLVGKIWAHGAAAAQPSPAAPANS